MRQLTRSREEKSREIQPVEILATNYRLVTSPVRARVTTRARDLIFTPLWQCDISKTIASPAQAQICSYNCSLTKAGLHLKKTLNILIFAAKYCIVKHSILHTVHLRT